MVFYKIARDPAGKKALDFLEISVDPSITYIILLLVHIFTPIFSILGLIIY